MNFQTKVASALRNIFGANLVKTEWDTSKYDGHTFNHKEIYAPRLDIAVGPFNSYADLDLGIDNTKEMQFNPLTKRLIKVACRNSGKSLDKTLNPMPLCQLAIEIEFNGSAKHMLGSIINACVSGSMALVIASNNNKQKIYRAHTYLMRLDNNEKINLNYLSNLIIFTEDEFLNLLAEYTAVLVK